jgi:hypothetical protein
MSFRKTKSWFNFDDYYLHKNNNNNNEYCEDNFKKAIGIRKENKFNGSCEKI